MLVDALVMAPALWVGMNYYRYSYGSTIGVVWAAGMLVITSAYFVYFHGRYGQTIGKRLLRIRVLSAKDEKPIGYAMAIRRESTWIVWGGLTAFSLHWLNDAMPSVAASISTAETVWWFADILVLLLNSRRRAIHDFIGGTVVRKEEFNQSIEATRGRAAQ